MKTNNGYYKNHLHKEDGPAIEDRQGGKYWYLNGKYIPDYWDADMIQKIGRVPEETA